MLSILFRVKCHFLHAQILIMHDTGIFCSHITKRERLPCFFCLFYPKSLSRRAEKKEPDAGFSGGNPCTDKNPSAIRSPPPAHTIFNTIAAFPDVPQPRTAHSHPHTSTSKYTNLPPQKNSPATHTLGTALLSSEYFAGGKTYKLRRVYGQNFRLTAGRLHQ